MIIGRESWKVKGVRGIRGKSRRPRVVDRQLDRQLFRRVRCKSLWHKGSDAMTGRQQTTGAYYIIYANYKK